MWESWQAESGHGVDHVAGAETIVNVKITLLNKKGPGMPDWRLQEIKMLLRLDSEVTEVVNTKNIACGVS